MSKAPTAFRTISEVSEELDVPKHVLRFWEMKFPQIKPMKRGGGRRYYRPEDLALLKGICHLLHAEAYTIKGVQKILRERGVDAVKDLGAEPPAPKKRAGGRTAETVDRATAPGAALGEAPPAAKSAAAKATKATKPRRGKGKSATETLGEAGQIADADVVAALNRAIDELQACRKALLGNPPAAKKPAKSRGRTGTGQARG